MNEELRTRALEKMLTEMNEKHSPAADKVHNWLCDQEDEELFQGITKEGKSIAGSLSYAKSKAQKEAKDGVACIEDETVFGWVADYFKTEAVIETKPQNQSPEEQEALDARVQATKKAREDAKAEAKKAAKVKAKEDAESQQKRDLAAAMKAAKAPANQTSIFDF